MNEELHVKIDTLKERINNLLEREEELKAELNLILAKDQDALTNGEVHHKERIEKQLEVIANSKENVLAPKTQLLDEYLRAEIIIGKISQEGINKSVRTKAINSLASILVNIKKLDESVAFTEDDARKLQIERNNEAAFNPLFNNISDTITNNIELTIRELNKELDKLERSNGKLDKTSNSTVKKIIATLLLATTTIGAVKFVRAAEKKNVNYNASMRDMPRYEGTYEYDENATIVFGNNENTSYTPVTPLPTIAPAPITTPLPVATPVQTFNPGTDKVTDMNNRANVIAGTGFFEDLYNSEIVDVLEAIDNKDLISPENIEYANLFRNKFNSIVEHYFWDTITEEDVKSIEALRYLAKDNSDLDRFLETFANLLQDILRNPGSQEAKDKMNAYLKIFAGHLAGFNHPNDTDSALTNDATFNENAEVKDFYDWEMLKELVIDPTYIMFYPKDILLETDGVEIENIMNGVLNKTIDITTLSESMQKYVHAVETFMEIESALVNHPQYCEIVGYNYDENVALVRGN